MMRRFLNWISPFRVFRILGEEVKEGLSDPSEDYQVGCDNCDSHEIYIACPDLCKSCYDYQQEGWTLISDKEMPFEQDVEMIGQNPTYIGSGWDGVHGWCRYYDGQEGYYDGRVTHWRHIKN